MSLLDELRVKREARAAEMARRSDDQAETERTTVRQLRTDKLNRAAQTVIANLRWLFGVLTALVCGWSISALGLNMGMPLWVGLVAAAVIDGAWLYCTLQVHVHRDAPYRALGAHTTAKFLLAVSVVLNVLHGLTGFGTTAKGIGAAALFAFFPIALKVVIAQSTVNPLAEILKVPGGKEVVRQMGLDRARSALAAMQERDRIERYALERAAEVELARLDLKAEADVSGLQAELELAARTAAALSAGPSGHTEQSSGSSGQIEAPVSGQPGPEWITSAPKTPATAPTGQDVVSGQPGQPVPTVPDARGQVKIVRDLLDSGVPREKVVDEVLKIRPELKEDSVRRTLSRELRSGNHI